MGRDANRHGGAIGTFRPAGLWLPPPGSGKIAAMRRPALWSFLFLAAYLPAQRLTPEMLWQLGRVSEPRLSPDGKQLAFVVRTFDLAADSGNSQVFVHRLDSGVT